MQEKNWSNYGDMMTEECFSGFLPEEAEVMMTAVETNPEPIEDKTRNRMELTFLSKSSNEGLARMAAAAFVAYLNPTIEELTDIKTAVTEAVTNAIIHGYGNEDGVIVMNAWVEQHILSIEIIDEGQGIVDVERAMEPLYTTRPDLERSGMGFAFMKAFMDELTVESTFGVGTRVHMKKGIGVTKGDIDATELYFGSE